METGPQMASLYKVETRKKKLTQNSGALQRVPFESSAED
jgi:hypothetical protein